MRRGDDRRDRDYYSGVRQASSYDNDRERNSQRQYDRDRERDRNFDRRERRSNSRERKRAREDEGEGGQLQYQSRPSIEPSATIVVKGLPNHTTEPTLYTVLGPFYPKAIRLITQRDGECKGYAFVEFHGEEYAQYFMTTYAGSAGDPNAPQFIVENRAVTLEYARDGGKFGTDRDAGQGHGGSSGVVGGGGGSRGRPIKTDWLCEMCSCHNFSRRDSCFRCSTPRSERSVSVPFATAPAMGGADAHLDPACNVPGEFLVVKGLSPMIQEEQIQELYRQFAVVKSVSLLRDPAAHFARGLAFVEFTSPEFAHYALQRTNGMAFGAADMAVGGDNTIQVAFARVDVMQAMLKKAHKPGAAMAVNPLVAQALQAAQWSANNGYATAPVATMTSAVPLVPAPPPPNAPGAPHLSNGTVSTTASVEIHVPAVPTAPLPVRFPPNFDTNGGSYIFQAKSGYFLEPTTDFYYDPKHKRYFCGRNGCYYTYDASREPAFQLFCPPLPVGGPQDETRTAIATEGVGNNGEAAALGKTKIGGSASTTATKGGVAVGFGFGLTVNKKTKLDIAKWGALQQQDEEEVEEDPRHKGRKLTAASVPSGADKTVQVEKKQPAAAVPAQVESTIPTILSVNRTAPPSALAPASAPAAPTAAPIAPSAAATAPPQSATAQVNGAPVCLLCQRQFASVEMLQRHERESKLHADNLAKLQAGGLQQ